MSNAREPERNVTKPSYSAPGGGKGGNRGGGVIGTGNSDDENARDREGDDKNMRNNGSGGSRPADWPSAQGFNEAIQNLAHSMADDELRGGEPTVNKLGLPMPYSGGFADIYRVHCPATGNTWAVKCFTRGVAGLQQRYAAISQHLKSVDLPFMVDFEYIDQGVRIGRTWYPIVKMRWIEGLNLNTFVAQSLEHPATLDQLFNLWVRLSSRLRLAGIAHADLQHGNVLLVQRPGTDRLGLRLVDYDGMYVPALAGQRSGEVGHPAFQHPQRLREGTYNRDVDRFSHLAICCAVRALRVGGRELWDRYDNGQNLLFVEKDFAAPGESELFRSLWQLPHPDVRNLVGRLALATQTRLEQTPAIDELIENGRLRPLTDEETNAVQSLLEPDRPYDHHFESHGPFVPFDSPGPPDSPDSPGLPDSPGPPNETPEPAHERGLVPYVLKKIDDWLARVVRSDDPRNLDLARCALLLIALCGPALLTMLVTWSTTSSRKEAPDSVAPLQAARDALAEEQHKSKTLSDSVDQHKSTTTLLRFELEAAKNALSQERDRTQQLSSKVEQLQTAVDAAVTNWKAAEVARDAALQDRASRPPPVSVPFDFASRELVRPGMFPGVWLVVAAKGVPVRFRWCPPGSFEMGTQPNLLDRTGDESQITVTLTRGFWMMETECWQKLWVTVMDTPQDWNDGRGDLYPAYGVSHEDAMSFAQKFQAILREDEQLPWTWSAVLPTEAQWEYAIRAGGKGLYCFGDNPNSLEDYAWFSENSGFRTHPVQTKKPNAWGLHDGHGSVREWTADRYATSLAGGRDPTGPAKGSLHVVRGGGWSHPADQCRSAYRTALAPKLKSSDLGFRLVLVQSP